MALGFGVETSGLSRTTQNTVQTAKKINNLGKIIETKSFGGIEVKTEEDYAPGSFTNAAVDGQTGTSVAGVVIENTIEEVAEDYAKERTVTERPHGA